MREDTKTAEVEEQDTETAEVEEQAVETISDEQLVANAVALSNQPKEQTVSSIFNDAIEKCAVNVTFKENKDDETVRVTATCAGRTRYVTISTSGITESVNAHRTAEIAVRSVIKAASNV